ncbi:MAG: Rieske (2Fe-2S) protein [Bacteroidetes bacterium]|nr:Rieske (2Fe-2S) protein [Bacteroidota bacterium]
MNRKDFFKFSALAIAGVAVGGSFLESCKKSTTGPQGPDVNFTIDLNDSKYSALSASGGYVYVQNVIIARISDMLDGFIAVAQTCTHQGCTVTYARGSQTFVCPCHGGTYDLNGNVTAGPPPYPIKRYSVSRSGNNLTVSG